MEQCCGLDHHEAGYTARQRADLDRVLAFNRRLAAAIDAGRDTAEVVAALDPDPLRYMWVDEGSGRLTEYLATAEALLTAAPPLPGHRRVPGHGVARPPRSADAPATADGARPTAARPAIAVAADGRELAVWIDWEAGVGERVVAALDGVPIVLTPEAADVFRPSATFDADGVPWVFYGRATDTGVSVHAQRHDGAWSTPERISDTGHPSFNQEVVATPRGLEVVWQGPHGTGFGIWSRRWSGTAWEPTRLASAGAAGNAWDPAVAALPDGRSVYAWSEYVDGSYRVVVRIADGPIRPISAGTDYALHPSLAVTTDGGIWCAFDLIAVHGHGGSGPTRLRRAEELAEAPTLLGARDPGDAIPPELLPDVTAALRVVRLTPDGVQEADGLLAPGLDVVPGGLPRLAADANGGLTVAYRIHRRLPLMTYYWEVAAQTLGPDGWSAPVTFQGSDGTLEEPAICPAPGGVRIVWQTDGRLERSLTWTEGFGGRECPVLLEHLGSVVWHGMHGTGQVRTTDLPAAAGPALAGPAAPTIESNDRREAREWLGAGTGRYTTEVDGETLTLYWGDLHRHSLVSRCTSGDEPSLEDFYRYGWDVCDYDFWAVTDHSENSSEYQWWSIQKIADLFRVDDRFVPFYGFEWTGNTGHQNVIYGSVDRGAPIYSSFAAGSQTPDELWASLRRHPAYPALTIPHHPGSAMIPYDWNYGDPEYLRLVEVFQACRGNYEHDGAFRQYSDATRHGTFVADGLGKGHRFGLIASSDHGNGASYVGAFAERLTRDGVFTALRNRRVFGATTRDVLVDVRVGGAFMGSEIRRDGPVDIEVYARGFRDLARIELVRNGETVRVRAPERHLPDGHLELPIRVEFGQSGTTTDWSGHLTIDGGRILATPYWSPEVTAADERTVRWTASTKSFGEPYGAQRGGVEMTLLGPPDARVTVNGTETTLEKLIGLTLPGGEGGRLTVIPATGGLTSLGAAEQRLTWTDDPGRGAYYYVRVIQVDGEMAWSSPVWVDTDQPSGDTPR
ncbi:DUF3604 domain-containing protein [Cryptosporangium aurantiacum]|uniref:DUF3604 domain-containing protein n=1 Tax=Cryptosporangium aurantiacum TaxID=134849 RepID=A0A1M7TVZ5_9ACTN|nr:DUF3604 domain-containing protein [Cryptosporangium aurantiacum]SHN74914.1 Protein of unknown function [Cryptosporangium aurantiacum]